MTEEFNTETASIQELRAQAQDTEIAQLRLQIQALTALSDSLKTQRDDLQDEYDELSAKTKAPSPLEAAIQDFISTAMASVKEAWFEELSAEIDTRIGRSAEEAIEDYVNGRDFECAVRNAVNDLSFSIEVR